ncbi:hypothetical protein [Acaryochloris sp. IP29b_bin.148]|uniref:hypothetical protein n=1 Tax=Acaryochloris sp. IP29b_bin.148 TaxID=2969218 RepID=UPI002601AB5B|nr:hypothetical protein [Acaryochloris sp. IP29b_bin.148]
MSKSQYLSPNPSKVLYLLAEIQKHLHNGTIRHELSQIVRHTRDKEILDVCRRAAKCLDIHIDARFHKLDEEQHIYSLRTLVKHMKWAKEKFDEVVKLVPNCNPKWVESPFRATEKQLLSLSDYLTRLDKVPDTTDMNGKVIKVGDLVAISCKDEKDRNYDHYGVVIPSAKGFRVAHFFTGSTIRPQNSLVEKGFGYVHETSYEPQWIVKEHHPETIPYSQVEKRIKKSRNTETRVWNKLSYNCEHWAREMFCGQPSCTQLDKWRKRDTETGED